MGADARPSDYAQFLCATAQHFGTLSDIPGKLSKVVIRVPTLVPAQRGNGFDLHLRFPEGSLRFALRLLQFLPGSFQPQSHARDGIRHRGSCLEHPRDASVRRTKNEGGTKSVTIIGQVPYFH